jgi:hypothetical protein
VRRQAVSKTFLHSASLTQPNCLGASIKESSPSSESVNGIAQGQEEETAGGVEGTDTATSNSSRGSMSSSASAFLNSAISTLGFNQDISESAAGEEDVESDAKDDQAAKAKQEESVFGLGLAFSKVGKLTIGATKVLKDTVESSSFVSEFNKEQEKFIQEKRKKFIFCSFWLFHK